MAPKCKLYYFNFRGRCEISRLILTCSGIDFEDIRLDDSQWAVAKASGVFPSDQLPCLEVDGKKYGQSFAIARYLARETGLAGKTSLEQMKVDAIVDSIMDLLNRVWAYEDAKNEDASKKLWKEISTQVAPRVFNNLEKCAAGPFFLGDRLTWADLLFFDACETFESHKVTQFMKKHVCLNELRETVSSLPPLAAYLAMRARSHF